MDGFVNIYSSRRTFKIKCLWYKAHNDNEKLTYDAKPNGYFYAKMVNALTGEKSNIGGFLQINKDSLTIMTADEVREIKSNDKIVINGNDYKVAQVQRQPIKTQSEFAIDFDYYTYISLQGI